MYYFDKNFLVYQKRIQPLESNSQKHRFLIPISKDNTLINYNKEKIRTVSINGKVEK